MGWFIKTETFRRPREQVVPHLAEHRRWVEDLRRCGVVMTSGYLVDEQGRPGGGGFLLFQEVDHAAAEALISQDPMIISGCVEWRLQGWIPSVGDLGVL